MRFGKFGSCLPTRGWKTSVLAAAAAALVLCTCACGKKAPPQPSASPSASPTAAPVAADAVEKVKIATVKSIDGPLNIRSGANTDSEVLGSAYTGDKFEVVKENFSADWHEVLYNGKKAYLFAEFVKITEEEKSVLDAAKPGTDAQSDATPDPNAPITVNGSGRSEVVPENDGDKTTVDAITDDDPGHR